MTCAALNVILLLEVFEQNGSTESPVLKNLEGKSRKESVNIINTQVQEKLNILANELSAIKVVADVNDDVKAWKKKHFLKKTFKDEQYLTIENKELKISDNFEGSKGVKQIDLDNGKHRALVAKFLELGKKGLGDKSAYKELIGYINELNKLENDLNKEKAKELGLSKKETKQLKKTLRKNLDLDNNEGGFANVLSATPVASVNTPKPTVPETTQVDVKKIELASDKLNVIKGYFRVPRDVQKVSEVKVNDIVQGYEVTTKDGILYLQHIPGNPAAEEEEEQQDAIELATFDSKTGVFTPVSATVNEVPVGSNKIAKRNDDTERQIVIEAKPTTPASPAAKTDPAPAAMPEAEAVNKEFGPRVDALGKYLDPKNPNDYIGKVRKSPKVKEMQELIWDLKEAYKLNINTGSYKTKEAFADSVFGTTTKGAVRDLQGIINTRKDGGYGNLTQSALKAWLINPQVIPEATVKNTPASGTKPITMAKGVTTKAASESVPDDDLSDVEAGDAVAPLKSTAKPIATESPKSPVVTPAQNTPENVIGSNVLEEKALMDLFNPIPSNIYIAYGKEKGGDKKPEQLWVKDVNDQDQGVILIPVVGKDGKVSKFNSYVYDSQEETTTEGNQTTRYIYSTEKKADGKWTIKADLKVPPVQGGGNTGEKKQTETSKQGFPDPAWNLGETAPIQGVMTGNEQTNAFGNSPVPDFGLGVAFGGGVNGGTEKGTPPTETGTNNSNIAKENIYEGDLKDGKREGEGTLTYGSGSPYAGAKYEGGFRDNQFSHKGTFTKPDGWKLYGDRLNGKFIDGNKKIYTLDDIRKGINGADKLPWIKDGSNFSGSGTTEQKSTANNSVEQQKGPHEALLLGAFVSSPDIIISYQSGQYGEQLLVKKNDDPKSLVLNPTINANGVLDGFDAWNGKDNKRQTDAYYYSLEDADDKKKVVATPVGLSKERPTINMNDTGLNKR